MSEQYSLTQVMFERIGLAAGVARRAATWTIRADTITQPRPETRPAPLLPNGEPHPSGDLQERTSDPGPESLPERGIPSGRGITGRISVETTLYGVFILLAVVTRFWDLGSRTLHHDESLHAYYSWLLATGQGYVHNPLMHGPFLFHANALVYLLFGDSDASSRFMPALFGVVLVGLPFLLRGPLHLGRWGALAASALFLISPSFLYYSRYIRHDIYTIVGTFLLFICIVRYIERPERRWLVTGGAAIGLLLTNHEIVFAVLFAFFAYLWGTLLWGRLRPLVPLHLATAAIAVAIVLGFPHLEGQTVPGLPRFRFEPLPAIPWQNPTPEQEQRYYVDLLTNPLILALALLVVVFVLASAAVLNRRRDPDRSGEGLVSGILGGEPEGSVAAAAARAWADGTGLLAAFGVAAGIFVLLYTTFFTNLNGLATGTYATNGTLLYWLGQQGVQRGEQPWFYYLLLTPQYEFLAVIFGLAVIGVTLWRAVRQHWGDHLAGPAFPFRLFLIVWFVLIFAGLSYAGEKMPWLIIHIALPLILLAASLLGELVTRLLARATVTWPGIRHGLLVDRTGEHQGWAIPGLAGALLLLAGGWVLLAGRLTHGTFAQASGSAWRRDLSPATLDRWWQLTLPPLAAVVLLAGAWRGLGRQRTARAALAAVVLGLSLLQIHAGWRLSYLEGDVPKDMLVYTQSSPDVLRMAREMDALSKETTGGKDLEIWYDTRNAWPTRWYFRDYANLHSYSGSPGSASKEAAVVIAAAGSGRLSASALRGYTAQDYVLRWWFPEEIYRDFAIAPEIPAGRSAWRSADAPHGPGAIAASVADSLATQLDPSGQQRVYRLLMYRDLPSPIGTYDYTLYVRDDLVPLLNRIRYGPGGAGEES
ncbi:MAG: TIGR03663 family protein [Chloroflexota bacterium]|nr:TIGR03663 family protein [Chloroflexota bacterium]